MEKTDPFLTKKLLINILESNGNTLTYQDFVSFFIYYRFHL